MSGRAGRRSSVLARLAVWVLAPALALGVALAGLLGLQREKIQVGAEGYLYGLPLVLMDLTRAEFAAQQAPAERLRRVRQPPTAAFREVVRPTVDLLYTSAFIDLDAGPWVLRLPPNPAHFEVFSLLDAWTDVFAAPGTRSHGAAGGTYLLAGPRWQGAAPAGMTLLRGETRMAWMIGRTQIHGPQDLPAVHRLQDGISLEPLAGAGAAPAPAAAAVPQVGSAFAPTPTPTPSAGASAPPAPGRQDPAGMASAKGEPPLAQLRRLPTRDFFQRLSALMVDNPPRAADQVMTMKLARLGVAPGQAPAWGWLDASSVALGRWLADFQLRRELAKPRDTVQGWQTPPDLLGRYGTAYNIRAAVALVGLGANLPEDAIYPSARVDGEGKALDGAQRYRIRFLPGQMPPARAFWSVTAYGADDYLMDVPEARHAVGSRQPLVPQADGSVDLLVQADPPPPQLRANWLPVRAGEPFQLTARLYWPEEAALQGRWRMPAIERVR